MPKSPSGRKPAGKKADDSRSKTFHYGYPKEDVAKIKKKAWWCGDYICDTAGSGSWVVGNVYRICGPDWDHCPATTTLSDGSKWTFAANCKQDG